MLILTQIQFAGYRSFPSRLTGPATNILPLRPITLVIGKNGAGKSQVLRLVLQTVAGICSEEPLPLPNSAGGVSFCRAPHDNFHLRSPAHPMSVRLEWRWNDEPGAMDLLLAGPDPVRGTDGITVITWKLSQGPNLVAKGSEGPLPWNQDPWSQIREEFKALWTPSSALAGFRDRIRTSYPLPEGARARLGGQGEQAAEWLYRSNPLYERARDWLAQHLPPAGLELDASRGELRLFEHRGGAEINLADAAEGLHQVLPVVTLWCARALEGTPTLDAVKQPELHLHDGVHAALGDLALEAAGIMNGGLDSDRGQRQLIETHSEGLLLRVRRRIAEGLVRADQVSLAFVDRDARGSRLVPIPLTPEGDPERWPDGIFLERLAEAKAIAVAQRSRRSGSAV